MPALRSLLPLALALLAAQPLSAQLIRGRVVDAATGEGVAEATVAALASGTRAAARVRTGADGTFDLPLRRPGEFTVRVERTGYQPVTSRPLAISPAESVQVSVKISPSAVALDPLTIVARRGASRNPLLEPTGFYAREGRGVGRFYRRDFIEQRINRPLAGILDEVPGISIRRDLNGVDYVTFDRAQASGAFQRAARNQPDRCSPVFYLDGNRVAVGPRMLTANDLVTAAEIEAIEVYSGAAQLPPEFNGSDSACGVIVIWTRRNV